MPIKTIHCRIDPRDLLEVDRRPGEMMLRATTPRRLAKLGTSPHVFLSTTAAKLLRKELKKFIKDVEAREKQWVTTPKSLR